MIKTEEKTDITDKMEKKILVGVFFISMLVHFLCACFYKAGETYLDEYVYLQSAAGLANGDGFLSVHGEIIPYWDRVLYTILLSPGFVLKNGISRIVFFSFLNSLLVSISIIPAYCFFRDVIEDKKTILISVILFAVLPINLICMTFMVENLLIPFMYFAFWKLYKLYESFENNTVSSKLYLEIFIITVMSFFVKKPAMLFVCVFVATGGVLFIMQRKSVRTKLVLILFSLVTAMFFLYIKRNTVTAVIKIIESTGGLNVWVPEIIHCIFHIIVAGGFFLILLSLLFFDNYPVKIKYFIIALVIAVAITVYDISRKNIIYETQIYRANLRYLIFIWMPLWAFFIRAVRDFEFRTEKVRSAIIVAVSLVVIVFYRGVNPFSAVDYTMLYHINLFDFEKLPSKVLFITLFSSFVMIGMLLLMYNKRYFIVFFGVILLPVVVYNTKETYRVMHGGYMLHDSDFLSIQEHILNNYDKNYLIIDGTDDTLAQWSIQKESKCADFYLTYKNVYRTSGVKLLQVQQGNEGSLSVSTLPGYTGSVGHDYDLHIDHVDYILIANCNDFELEPDNCEIVDDNLGEFYTLYKLDDTTIMPRVVVAE